MTINDDLMISPGVASEEVSESIPADEVLPKDMDLHGAVNGSEERLHEEVVEFEPNTKATADTTQEKAANKKELNRLMQRLKDAESRLRKQADKNRRLKDDLDQQVADGEEILKNMKTTKKQNIELKERVRKLTAELDKFKKD